MEFIGSPTYSNDDENASDTFSEPIVEQAQAANEEPALKTYQNGEVWTSGSYERWRTRYDLGGMALNKVLHVDIIKDRIVEKED